jgi:Mg2+/Co2+ transporter CorB
MVELSIILGSIVVLLLLSAFFSGSETAMTAVSQPRMAELARQGDSRAGAVTRLRDRKERLIGTILLGNNLVNILASALATSLFIGWFGSSGVVYATLAMTALVLIFAEVMPKAYAIHNADRVALTIAPILRVFVTVLAPVAHAVQTFVEGVLRVFGIQFDTSLEDVTTEDELRGVIRMHKGPEPEVAQERVMLASILDLDDVEVGEIMTHRSNTTMIDASRPPAAIVRDVLASPYTRLPLYRGNEDNIVGVLHAKEMFRAVNAAKDGLQDLDVVRLATSPWFIPESTDLLDQLREFRRRREHFALVVDEYGTVQGVVTLEDILEEIVGDISDEHDEIVRGVRPLEDGAYLVNGDVTIRDLNRELGWELPDEGAATVAGLVMHEARRIPEVRQVFAFHGFRFEIMRRKGHQITALRVEPLPEDTIIGETPHGGAPLGVKD